MQNAPQSAADLWFQPVMSFSDTGKVLRVDLVEALTGDPSGLGNMSWIQLFLHDMKMIDAACAQLAEWLRCGTCPPDLRVSVNLAPEHFGHPRLMRRIQRALHRSGLAPWRLVIEIVETSRLADTPRTRSAFEGLHALGVLLSIDDGGAGFHATPRQLARVQTITGHRIYALKLDRPMRGDTRRGYRLIKALKLPVRIVVEWVESIADLDWVLKLRHLFPDCIFSVQGELFGLKCRPQELASRLGW